MGQSLASKQSLNRPRGGCPVTTVIEIPAELKQPILDLVSAYEKGRRKAETNRRLDCAEFEREVQMAAQECERAAMAGVLAAADVDAPRVRVEGKDLFRVGRFSTTYYCAAGEVSVERTLYREVRNGPTFDPVALKMGMVADVWLPGAADQMAHCLAEGTSREAAKTARKLGRLPFSRSSFERVGHEIGKQYVTRHADIDQELIETFELPEEAAGLSVSIDRVSVPMEESSGKAPRRKSRNKKRRKGKKDRKKRKTKRREGIERNYRMAYCGTISVVDADGEALHTIRYGRMPQGDAVDLAQGLASDTFALLDKKPSLSVTLVADGAPELWNLLDGQLNEQTLGKAPHRLIDYYHLVDKLDAAAKEVHGEQGAKPVLRRWKTRLLNAKTGATMISTELRETANSSKAVQDAITYIENNADRMDYATARANARRIGSGAVEATCKSLVALRMKRPGARWKEDTGEHVIQLRALLLSDRWDPALRLTLQPLRKTVRRAA